MEEIKLNTGLKKEFIQQVKELSGQTVEICNQCGKCTAGCPAEFAMDLTPNQIIRLLQLGQKDTVLGCHSIWLCISCITCTARCPRGIDIAALFDVLRIIARRENVSSPEPEIRLFQDSFLNLIRKSGRLHELSLILGFNIRTFKWFNDADLASKILGRGKLHILPRKIKGVDQVRQIYGRVGK